MTFYIDLEKEYIDRYELPKVCQRIEERYLTITSYFLHKFKKLPPTGYYKVLSEVMRADTVSYRYFNQEEEFWWLILYYNKLIKFQDLKSGMILKLFNVSDLESLINEMNIKEQLIQQNG